MDTEPLDCGVLGEPRRPAGPGGRASRASSPRPPSRRKREGPRHGHAVSGAAPTPAWRARGRRSRPAKQGAGGARARPVRHRRRSPARVVQRRCGGRPARGHRRRAAPSGPGELRPPVETVPVLRSRFVVEGRCRHPGDPTHTTPAGRRVSGREFLPRQRPADADFGRPRPAAPCHRIADLLDWVEHRTPSTKSRGRPGRNDASPRR